MKNHLVHSFSLLRKDNTLLILSLVPLLIGAFLYFLLGYWIYGGLLEWIKEILRPWITVELGAVSSLLNLVLGIIFYFMVSWTFVLTVSLLSAPFNDMMSSRVERLILGQRPVGLGSSLKETVLRLPHIFFNEIKKITAIIALLLLGFLFSFIPFLFPLTLLISCLLLSIGFIDYNWCRHEYPLRSCLKNLWENLANYTLGGAFFSLMVSVPFVNFLVPPLATVYFTLVFTHKHQGKGQD